MKITFLLMKGGMAMKEQEKMCSGEGCRGKLSTESVPLSTENGKARAFPCRTCGLLHWGSGEPVIRNGQYAFIENGDFTLKAVEEAYA